MTMYRVCWEIDVRAESIRDAAAVARRYQLDPNSTATFFTVARHPLSDELGDQVFTEVEL